MNERLTKLFNEMRQWLIIRLFWGRHNLYKQTIHLVLTFILLIFLFTGLSLRLSNSTTGSKIIALTENFADTDLLQQGTGIETVLASSPDILFNYSEYVTNGSDTLDSISAAYKVTKATIKDSNRYIFSDYNRYSNENINSGEKLLIPEIDGVIYEVQDNDSLDSIFSKVSGDIDKTIQLNQLESRPLRRGMKILIPNGSIPAPTPPQQIIYASVPAYTGTTSGFVNPLLFCPGYTFTQGFSAYHNGVDLARYIGCPINAIGNGVVTSAGWGPYGEGYHIKIDHGGGAYSYYYHGNGAFYVKVGDVVQQGQYIMDMGVSGNATGPHLHFSLFQGGYFVNPASYFPI